MSQIAASVNMGEWALEKLKSTCENCKACKPWAKNADCRIHYTLFAKKNIVFDDMSFFLDSSNNCKYFQPRGDFDGE